MLRIKAIIILSLVMSCQSKPVVEVQGHRGCRGLLPENSLQGFIKAVDLGVHTLELDLAVSKDGIVVVSHEPYMNPIICYKPDGSEISEDESKQFNIYQLTFAEIQKFDCGSKFHQNFPNQQLLPATKPSLEQVFRITESKNPNINYNIEIKAQPDYDGIFTPQPAEFVRLVLDQINNFNVFERSNLQSFDLRILEEVKRQAPEMKVAVLVDGQEKIFDKTNDLSFKPEIVSPYFQLLDQKMVKNLQRQKFKVIPWTVNDIEDMQRMVDFGVDAIITDYHDKLLSLLSE